MSKSSNRDAKCSCESEISNLNPLVVINKYILGLEVSVNNSSGVAKIKRSDDLVQKFLNKTANFDLEDGQTVFVLIKVLFKIKVKILENQVELFFHRLVNHIT